MATASMAMAPSASVQGADRLPHRQQPAGSFVRGYWPASDGNGRRPPFVRGVAKATGQMRGVRIHPHGAFRPVDARGLSAGRSRFSCFLLPFLPFWSGESPHPGQPAAGAALHASPNALEAEASPVVPVAEAATAARRRPRTRSLVWLSERIFMWPWTLAEPRSRRVW